MTDDTSPKRFSFYNGSNDDDKNATNGLEMAPLSGSNNGDATEKYNNHQQQQEPPLFNVAPCGSFCAYLFAYVTYTCEYAPKLCWTVGVIALIIPMYLLVMGVLANPTERFGVINHDFTEVQSQYDFSIKDIDHWCLKGDNDSCQCEDPLQPAPRSEYRVWSKAHFGNVRQINNLLEQDLKEPDIAFFGGSVVEKMDGQWFGVTQDDRLKKVAKIFNKHFTNLDGEAYGENSLTAVALGIAGDTNPAVLWRLMNGEMPDKFNPKIWWLEIGLNDLGRAQCSEEVVVLGILRVVEEIMSKKPHAKIVINSLFPMASLRENINPDRDSGLEQSFGNKPKKEKKAGRGKTREKGLKRSLTNVDIPSAERNLRRDDGFRESRPHKGVVKMNPEKKKQHKFNPVTHKEKKKLPLWTSITAVNRELMKFSRKHDNVFFFDATKIFTEKDGKWFTLRTDLITMTGIPTEQGFDAWEAKVVARATEILNAGN
jgi:hypothetical protein